MKLTKKNKKSFGMIAVGLLLLYFYNKSKGHSNQTMGFDNTSGTPFQDVFMEERKSLPRDVNTVFDADSGKPIHNALNYHKAERLDFYMDDESPFTDFEDSLATDLI